MESPLKPHSYSSLNIIKDRQTSMESSLKTHSYSSLIIMKDRSKVDFGAAQKPRRQVCRMCHPLSVTRPPELRSLRMKQMCLTMKCVAEAFSHKNSNTTEVLAQIYLKTAKL